MRPFLTLSFILLTLGIAIAQVGISTSPTSRNNAQDLQNAGEDAVSTSLNVKRLTQSRYAYLQNERNTLANFRPSALDNVSTFATSLATVRDYIDEAAAWEAELLTEMQLAGERVEDEEAIIYGVPKGKQSGAESTYTLAEMTKNIEEIRMQRNHAAAICDLQKADVRCPVE